LEPSSPAMYKASGAAAATASECAPQQINSGPWQFC
jgi:hypothetical protein